MNFIAIDFETAAYSQDSACSIGMVKFVNNEPVEQFYSLICPPRLYIRPDFTEIHGLTIDDVRDAPKFDEIWDSVLNFIGDFSLAAHNASFDMGVLRAVLVKYNLPIPKLSYFCTVNLSRKTWPQLKSHALTAMAANFNIIYDAHNALEDALTCGKLVIMAGEKFGVDNIKQLPLTINTLQ